MRKLFTVLGLLCLLPGPGRCQAAGAEAEVRDLFDRYKAALLQGDGQLASELVDADTLTFFDEIRTLALAGDEESIHARPFVDRLLIVTMRHELPADTLTGMGLEDLLQHAVTAGWIGRQSIAQLGMGAVEIDGDHATGVAVTGGLPPADGADVLYYHFVREEGAWKFRFHSLVDGINGLIASFTAQMGTDEDDLIFLLVEQLSGRKVLPDIWTRPQ